MNLKKNLLFGPALLTLALVAGAAHAQVEAPHRAADIGVNLMLSGVNEGDDIRYLASTSRSVGWDWTDIEFNVESVVDPSEALMLVGL